jgi:hypothetical protein
MKLRGVTALGFPLGAAKASSGKWRQTVVFLKRSGRGLG